MRLWTGGGVPLQVEMMGCKQTNGAVDTNSYGHFYLPALQWSLTLPWTTIYVFSFISDTSDRIRTC
jgi:hypothetical protein